MITLYLRQKHLERRSTGDREPLQGQVSSVRSVSEMCKRDALEVVRCVLAKKLQAHSENTQRDIGH
jgi:hypothetical protein